MGADDADTPQRHTRTDKTSVVPPVGMILPGTVQVTAITPQRTAAGQPLPLWRITLQGVVQGAGVDDPTHDLADLQCTLSFTTADEGLIHQIRARRLRFCLDLIQLQREGPEEGEVEDS